ncbi:MAG TPA: PAS domain S-box protein [Allosphingosinicella sp.]|nr:PAS domain S-box protein [Allosphingosinicella sp.]
MTDGIEFQKETSDRRFEVLVNAVTDYAIYMLDQEGNVATWNPGARRFKGYEADEIIGQHYSRFFTDEDLANRLPWKALEIAARDGKFEAEGWRVRKDGKRFWANAVIDPIRDEQGRLLGFAKITRDIGDKKEAERQLYESEQRFRMLVQGVQDYAIYMLDTDGRVTNWNTGAAKIKGYTESEIVGQHFSRFYTQEDRARGEPERALETAMREGKYEKEAWRVRKDGSRFWASVVLDPIHDDHGKLIGFAKVTRDISERRKANLELEEARAALAQSQKLQALGELTGGIAHDFNNLMTVIRGSADLLRRDGLSDEKRQRYLQAIIETADRAADLTSQLLAFSRRQALRPEVIDVNVRLDALGEVLSRTLDSKIVVELDLAPDLWPTEVDATQLETALLNAAFNARDAMPEGGRLTISTRNHPSDVGDSVCIALTDTGEGMPPEVVRRAFEPFFTTKPVGKGTGLGLSQIHGFAAQSGGRAEIESKASQGTTIRILLPRSTKPFAASAEDAIVPASRTGLNVLLVEDNKHVLAFAEHLLGELQHNVITAESGDCALALIDSHPIDLLLTDVVMPGMSGIELAHAVRKRFPAIPVVLASGYSDEILGGSGDEFEMLRKPFDAASVSRAIDKALRHKPAIPETGFQTV